MQQKCTIVQQPKKKIMNILKEILLNNNSLITESIRLKIYL